MADVTLRRRALGGARRLLAMLCHHLITNHLVHQLDWSEFFYHTCPTHTYTRGRL